MIGAHVNSMGEYTMRRNEKPLRRVTNGRVRWVARATGKDGHRKSYGTFDVKGPCRAPEANGSCCAQHRIHWAYEQDTARPEKVGTVRAYAGVWLKEHPRSERSNRALQGRVDAVLDENLGDGRFGDMLFADVERKHAVKLREVLLVRQGRALRGARSVIGAVNTMWLDALDDGWTRTQSPFLRLKIKASDPRIRKAARKPRLLSWERICAIAAAGGEHAPMLLVLGECGVRIGEALAVQRCDVKLGAGPCDEQECVAIGPHLHFRRKAWDGSTYDGTKTTERVAPITQALAVLLGRVTPIAPDGLMFPRPGGGVWWDANWRRDVWAPATEAAGEAGVNPHDFRHSWVSRMRAAGLDVADVAETAGHSVDTATRVYTHSLGRSHDAMRAVNGGREVA